MTVRCIVNPENPTEIWGTLDGREPTESDHDFGADFYWRGNEIEVTNAVANIVATIEAAAARSAELTEKPLFIPLRTEWFEKFDSGEKDTEYRAYGPRWNERTCRVGREATISHGYSGKRLKRRVAGFVKMSRMAAPYSARQIYPDAEFIAAIHLPAST